MWWILAQLGRRLGLDVLGGGLDPDGATDEALVRRMATSARTGADALLAAGSEGIDPPRSYGWVRERALPEGRFRLLPPGFLDRLRERLAQPTRSESFFLVASRQLTRTNATPYMSPAKSPDGPALHVHPEDAALLGLRAGSAAEVKSAFGAIEANVALDASLRRGVVSVSQGWFETNVGNLTSSTFAIDPLTCQPAMTAIDVRVARVTRPGPG